jgi:hypothetical protein
MNLLSKDEQQITVPIAAAKRMRVLNALIEGCSLLAQKVFLFS